ncbi:hypothetical protein [Streptomyces sp. NBC_00347]|nr:hypothetical protein [Streptomyces sp. NBC_00347]MCX5126876.1 hypothetical protein [Streptomyces sp. NBC_00347]
MGRADRQQVVFRDELGLEDLVDLVSVLVVHRGPLMLAHVPLP